jgi:hypothetical protein
MTRLEKSGEPPAQLSPERVGGGVRFSPETRYSLTEGAGRSVENEGESLQDSGSGGMGKALRRFGGLSALNPGERKLSRGVRFRSRSKILTRPVGCWTTIFG